MMVAAVLLCSCGGLTNISTPNSVALNRGNFKFIKTVTAETKATYVFAIGGLSPRATADVVEKLKVVAQLQPNQALADIRIKTTTKLWVFGIVTTRSLTATASVVEFLDAGTKESNKSVIMPENRSSSNIEVVDPTSVIADTGRSEQKDSVVEFPTEVTQKHTRANIFNRLKEINATLQKEDVDNINEIATEIADIEKWYNLNGINTLDENKEFRKAKKLLQSKK